jgi:hypothetical protein
LTIVSSPGDPRIPAVREAVAFWNQTAKVGPPEIAHCAMCVDK